MLHSEHLTTTVVLLGSKLEYMLAGLLIFMLVGCVGLFAALQPEAYARYFLAESQRRALSSNLKALSLTASAIFVGCMVVVLAIPLHGSWNLLAPVSEPIFFFVCAVAYVWWGIGLLRNPESFLKRTTEPWSRVPTWVIKGFGSVLLLGAVGFLYGFALRIRGLLR
jgi:hypothetical protein